jgi:hypothetical protein
MSTSSIFTAGAKLASLVLGKEGPIEVIYRNDNWDAPELPNYCDFTVKELEEECEAQGISSVITEEEVQEELASGSACFQTEKRPFSEWPKEHEIVQYILCVRLDEFAEKQPYPGALGRLFIGARESISRFPSTNGCGTRGEIITLNHIQTFIGILENNDYFRHYPLIDVFDCSDDEGPLKVQFEWCT